MSNTTLFWRRLATLTVLVCVLIGMYTAAHASPVATTTFKDGETLRAEKLNANFSALRDAINASSASTVPRAAPGTIIAFAGADCPERSIPADGASLKRVGTYEELFDAIGTTWGNTDDAHFNIPNLVGRFMRGAGTITDGHGGSALDLGQYQEAATRVYTPLITAGESVPHTHSESKISPNGELSGVNGGPNPGGFHTVGDNYATTSGGPSSDHTHSIPADQGDEETRPKAYGVNHCVYY